MTPATFPNCTTYYLCMSYYFTNILSLRYLISQNNKQNTQKLSRLVQCGTRFKDLSCIELESISFLLLLLPFALFLFSPFFPSFITQTYVEHFPSAANILGT